MYFSRQDQITAPPKLSRPARVGIGSNVLFLGLTSLLTDVSTEMVRAVIPLYLTASLGFTVLQFGLFDGIEQGVSALVRIAAGLAADRRRRYKEVAACGYGLSALCKLGLFLLGTAWGIAFLLLDRVGKGLRTAPRDALISLSVPPHRLGEAFGVHRAMDTAGAVAGPVLASLLLWLSPGRFDNIFLISFCIAIVGLAVILLFVENRAAPVASAPRAPRISWRDAVGVLRLARFRWIVLAGAALSLVTVSDHFIYLVLQRWPSLRQEFFPLYYVGTALPYLVLAVPAGRLADRLGRRRVLIAGHVLLAVVYALLLLPAASPALVILCLLLHGAYYAATDGVFAALASSLLPESHRTTGLAVLTTATSLARLLGSIAFGVAWGWLGVEWALGIFITALALGLVAAQGLLARHGEEATA